MNSSINNLESYRYDIFISHASESSLAFVEQLAEWFEKDNGIKCWYAPRNLDIAGAGKDYDDELVLAIQNSHCMVVVLNDDALQSKWVKHEVNQAEKRNMMIFPFVVSELTVNNGLLMRLEDRHLIAAYPDPEKRFPLLLKNVKQLLGQDVSGIKIKDEKDRNIKPTGSIDLDYEAGLAYLEVEQDRDAFVAFLSSAENGNKEASNKLVEIVQRNSKNAQFLDDSVWDRIEDLSDKGDSFADLLMHFKYYSMGTQNEVAVKYLLRALKKQEIPIAYLQLGICYGWGLGVPYSDVLAKKYYEKALEKDCGIACRYLGQLYRYGGDNIEKNLHKAEEYFRKGIEMKVASCYRQLLYLYSDMGENEKAYELAQQMIAEHIKGGYSLMGDYFFYCEHKQEQAQDWYKEAVKHKENDAWGKLAWLHWLNGEKEDASRLARRGFFENDSKSFKVLGLICEDKGEIDRAWDYIHQSALKFGTGLDGLARLYFDKNYLPNNYSLSDLKRDVKLSAKLQNLDSIKYLLKLMLQEHEKDDAIISYDNLKDLPESYEFLRLGAKEGDADLLFIYGRLLVESEGEIYNPFTGIDYIEAAAEKGHKNAITYVLKYYRKDSASKFLELSQQIVKSKSYAGQETRRVVDCFLDNNDMSLSFIDWLYRSLKILVWEDVAMFFDCFKVFRDAIENSKEKVKDWLDAQVDEFMNDYDDNTSILITPFYAYLLAVKLSMEKQDEGVSILPFVRNAIKIDDDILHMSKIPYFKDMVKMIWPDYEDGKILNGDFSNERDLRIFYGIKNESLSDVLDVVFETASEINEYVSRRGQQSYPGLFGLEATMTKCFYNAYMDLLWSYYQLNKKGVAHNLHVSLSIRPPYVCCSVEDTLQYSLNCLMMLIASRDAFGDKWQEVVNNLNNVESFPEMAETFDDINIRTLLCRYYDVIEARNKLLLFDIQLEHGSCQYIADTINSIIDELEKNNIQHELQRVTEYSLPDSIKDWRADMFEFSETLRNYITSD